MTTPHKATVTVHKRGKHWRAICLEGRTMSIQHTWQDAYNVATTHAEMFRHQEGSCHHLDVFIDWTDEYLQKSLPPKSQILNEFCKVDVHDWENGYNPATGDLADFCMRCGKRANYHGWL